MILKKVKTKIAAAVLMVALAICAVCGAFIGLSGQTASANATGTAIDISGTGGDLFNAANLQTVMGKIIGKDKASYNELKAYIDKQPEKQYESSLFNNGAGYFTVKLGGIDWNVVFASEDTNGEVVATLWQASSTLTSQWHTWYSTDKTLYYPSNMYGTSFIRASLVNSAYAYQAIDETTTGTSGSGSGSTANRQFFDHINTTNAVQTVEKLPITANTGKPSSTTAAEVEVPVNEVYQTYHPIVSKYDKYLDTPSQMPWQWYQSNQKIYGYDWWGNCKNDGIFGADYGSWWSPDDDYTGKNSYSAWGADKIWLPSGYETGYNNTWSGSTFPNPTQRSGIWGLPSSARLNNGEISWLRSGYHDLASSASFLNTDGNYYVNNVTSSYAVRPALHLNLKSAASAAGLVVDAPTFKDGTITKTVVYNGKEQEFELTTPEKGVSVAVSSPAAYDSTSHKIKATAAGTYTVTLSPNAGYGWSDGSIGPKQLTITIKPKELTAINWLNGTSALASDGKVTYTGNQIIINATADGADISTTDKETVKLPVIISGDNVNAGTFTATAINTNPNYVFSSSLDTTKTVTIEKKAISVDWNVANNAQFVYNGENFAPEATFIAANGLPVTLPITLTKGGTTVTEAVDAAEYVATVAAGDYFSNYNLASAATVSFKINKAQITASDVEWSFTEGAKFATGAKPSLTALYRYNNVTYSLTIAITTTDGNTTTWAAGGYTATASLATGMDNFEISGTVSRTFNLTETASGNYTVIWEGYSAVANYNGADQKPSGYIISDGEKLAISVAVEKWNGSAWVAATSAKDAGTYRFTATKDGYTLLNDKVECRIDPRVISVDYANLTGLTHGTTVNVIASTTDPVAKAEVDAGILTFAVTGSGRVAGTHIVSVEAQVDGIGGSKVASGNYSVSNSTAVQTIGKKVLSISDIEWKLNFTYDGNIKIPEGKVKASALTAGDLAGGAYVIFEFVYAVNAGNYNVKVLGISNDNYTYSGEMTLTIKDREISTVMWEGVQDGNSVVYNKLDQAPKAYIMIDGEKVYLEGKLEKYDPTTSTWGEVAYAINAGNFRLTVEEVTSGSGNYFYSEAVNNFTISRYELTAVYLTQNVFTYSGSNAGLEVYALGVGNERISVRDFTVLDDLGQSVTVYSDAGSYSVQVAIQTALGSNPNYTISSVLRTTFVINPQVVNVTFEITGNNWSWKADVATAPTVTVSASVANAIEVRYGKLGADNTKPAATNHGLSFVFQITGISGDGIITAVAKSKNYQITGTNVKTFNVIPVDGEATATFSFDGDVWSDDNLELEYDEVNGKTVAVSGDNDVEIKYYKDGVLLTDPITTTAGLDAGTYLVTASCPTRQLSTNITATTRTFKILPKEVDFADVEWVIDGNKVAGNTVSYNGQIYSATLNLGELADDFEVYYTNGTYKNVGNVRTTATIVAKNSNYKAVGAVESYDWAISGATATVAWNDDGTVASISGDSTAATGGSFFEKSGTSYKVVYKRDGVVLNSAPTEAGDYTAEVVLALGNDGNVNVTASSFSFSIGGPVIDNPTGNESGFSWWWIVLIVIASLALFFAICALIVANKRKATVVSSDEDGFYDDVTDEDLY